jgi:hypothetical protein
VDYIRFPYFIMEDSKNSKPVEVFRLHGVSVSVFANAVKDRDLPLYKVSLKRTYRKDGEFKSVTALGRDDLPIAQMLFKKAWLRILELEEEHWNDTEKSNSKSE